MKAKGINNEYEIIKYYLYNEEEKTYGFDLFFLKYKSDIIFKLGRISYNKILGYFTFKQTDNCVLSSNDLKNIYEFMKLLEKTKYNKSANKWLLL